MARRSVLTSRLREMRIKARIRSELASFFHFTTSPLNIISPATASLLVPNNRLFMVPGGGHLFMLHSIQIVAPVIREFLSAQQPIRPH